MQILLRMEYTDASLDTNPNGAGMIMTTAVRRTVRSETDGMAIGSGLDGKRHAKDISVEGREKISKSG